MEMRTWATKLVVEPSPSSPIREWLQDKLDQCGFDGNFTSRCVFSIIDRKQRSSPGLRIELCQSTESMFDCGMEGKHMSSMAIHNRSGLSGRRLSSGVEYGEVTEVMEILRLMSSPEDWELHTETIQRVVTELFDKLKNQHMNAAVEESNSSQPSAGQSPTSDFESSSSQDQAARYYEAFPSLSVQCDLIASANSSFESEWSRVAQLQPKAYDSPKSDEDCLMKPTNSVVISDPNFIYLDNRLPSGQSAPSSTRHTRSRRDRNRQSRYSAERSRRKNRISYIDQSRWPTSCASVQYFSSPDTRSAVTIGGFHPYRQMSHSWNERSASINEEQNDINPTSYKDRFSDLECNCWNKPSHEIDSVASERNSSSNRYEPICSESTRIAHRAGNLDLNTIVPPGISNAYTSELPCPLLSASDVDGAIVSNSSQSPASSSHDEFFGCYPHDPDLWPVLRSQRICMSRHRSIDHVGMLVGVPCETSPLDVDGTHFSNCMPACSSMALKDHLHPSVPQDLDWDEVPLRSMASVINEADKIQSALANLTVSSTSQNFTAVKETSPIEDKWSGVEIALAICDPKSVFQPHNCETISQIWQPLGIVKGEVVTSASNLDCSRVQHLQTGQSPVNVEAVNDLILINVPSSEDSNQFTHQRQVKSNVLLSSDDASAGMINQAFHREKLESDKNSVEVEVDETCVLRTLGNETVQTQVTLGNCEVRCTTWDSCIYAYPVSEQIESRKLTNEHGLKSVPDDKLDNLWSSIPSLYDGNELNTSYDGSHRILWSSTPKIETASCSTIQSNVFIPTSEYVAFFASQGDESSACDVFKPLESIQNEASFPMVNYFDDALIRDDWLNFPHPATSAGCQKADDVDKNGYLEYESVGELPPFESSCIRSAIEVGESCDVVGIVSDVISGNADVCFDVVSKEALQSSGIPLNQSAVANESTMNGLTRSIWESRGAMSSDLALNDEGLKNICTRDLSMNNPLKVDCSIGNASENISSRDSIISGEDTDCKCNEVEGKSLSSTSVSDIIFSDSDSRSSFAALTDVTSENSSVFYSSDSAEALELLNSCSVVEGADVDDEPFDSVANVDDRNIWELNQPSYLQLNNIWRSDLKSPCDVNCVCSEAIGVNDYLNVNCSKFHHLECVSPMLPNVGSVLVPSENTAFCDDIPQRMPRVVSEPVLSPYVPLSRLPRTLVIRHSSNSVYPQWQWSSANCVLTMKLSPSRQFRPISTPLSTDSEPDAVNACSTASTATEAIPTQNLGSSLSLGFLGDSEPQLEAGVVYQHFVAQSLSEDKLTARCPHDNAGVFLPRFKVRCELEKAAQTSSGTPPQKQIVQEILLGVSSEFHDNSSPCYNKNHLTDSYMLKSQLPVDDELQESKLVPRRLSQIWNRCDDSSEKSVNSSATTGYWCIGPDAAMCESSSAQEYSNADLDQTPGELEGPVARLVIFSDTNKAIWCPVAEDTMATTASNLDKPDPVACYETAAEKSELIDLTNKFESLGLCGKIWSNIKSDENADQSNLLAGTDETVDVPECEAALKAIWSKPDECISEEVTSNQPFTDMVAGIEGLIKLGMLMGPLEQRDSGTADFGQWSSASFEKDLMVFPPSDSVANQSYAGRRASQSAEAIQACLSGAYSIASSIRPLSMLSAYTDAKPSVEGSSILSMRSSSEHSYLWYPVISGGNDVSLSSVLASTTSQSTLFGSLPVSVSAGASGSEMNREQVLHLIKQLSPVMSSTSKHIGGSMCQLASTNSRPVDLWT